MISASAACRTADAHRAMAAKLNVGFMADTVSTSAGVDRLLTLQSRRRPTDRSSTSRDGAPLPIYSTWVSQSHC